MWEEIFTEINVHLFVFVRIAGMLVFNPFLARRNMPSQMRVAFILGLTLVIAPGVNGAPVADIAGIELMVAMARELFLGLSCGFVAQLYYYFIFYAGDIMDQQMGMSMAKVFDPGTSIQMSISGSLLSMLLALYFFVTDCHLLLIKLFDYSYEIIPVGASSMTIATVASVFIDLFLTVMGLALKLAVPIIAVVFIMDVTMGILMKLIPQIHVFVINMQFKVLTGMLMLFLLAGPISGFMSKYVDLMFSSMERIMLTLVS